MGFLDTIGELGYELVPVEQPFIKIKKFDTFNIANIVIIFDKETKTMNGGLVTVAPIRTLDDMCHQYKIFQDFQKDIKYFSKQTGYDII